MAAQGRHGQAGAGATGWKAWECTGKSLGAITLGVLSGWRRRRDWLQAWARPLLPQDARHDSSAAQASQR